MNDLGGERVVFQEEVSQIFNTCVWLRQAASVVMLIQRQSCRAAVVYDVASPGGPATATSQPNPESTNL